MTGKAEAWDARVSHGLSRLPAGVRTKILWLRAPSRRAIRLVCAGLLVLGGIFSILPVLGLWMLPLGLALVGDDFPKMKPVLETAARAVERMWSRVSRRQR